MGTNFYTMKGEHIGKRSAAGWYCWDCDITMVVGGLKNVHGSFHNQQYERCPQCGKERNKEDWKDTTAGRELGFNNQPPKRKTGVATCCSFSWAMVPDDIYRLRKMKDEYGRVYTRKEFVDSVLAECPIRFFDSIGVDFS